MRNGLLGATCLATIALAAPAFGADVKVVERDLVYTAAPGEFNELSLMVQGGVFTIQDGTTGWPSTLPVTAEAPCTPYDNGQSSGMMDATCPPDGVERVVVDVGEGGDYVGLFAMATASYPSMVALGDGADRFWGGGEADEVDGGEGADTITPNAGRDTIDAGPGDDAIDAIDGFPDEIACGDGYDLVDADDVDVVRGCENVRTGSPQQRPPGPPVTAPPTVTVPPVEPPVVDPAAGLSPPRLIDVISAWSTRADLARRGLVARVLCADGCYATSQLRLRTPATRRGFRVLGEGRAQRSDGGVAVVRTRLRPAAVRRLRGLRRPFLTLRLEVTSGTDTTTLSRRIRVSASR